jgi:hypothetical protein
MLREEMRLQGDASAGRCNDVQNVHCSLQVQVQEAVLTLHLCMLFILPWCTHF